MERTEMRMIRWMCGVSLKERQNCTEKTSRCRHTIGMDMSRGPNCGMDMSRGPKCGMDVSRGPKCGMDMSRGPNCGMDMSRGPKCGMDMWKERTMAIM